MHRVALTEKAGPTKNESKIVKYPAIEMGNYSVIVIIVIILLAIIDIVCYSLTGDNRNWQLLCNNCESEKYLLYFSIMFPVQRFKHFLH